MRRFLVGLIAAAVLFACTVRAQQPNMADKLGYPAGTRLLIIHADDLGVAHSADTASFRALEDHSVTSASVMVPCPWLPEVAAWARQHPDADLGLHLTLTAEWKDYRWGPVAAKDRVHGLLDPDGYLWPSVEGVVKHASAAEVEEEIASQVRMAKAAGIQPTHLDTHMGTLAARPDYYAALVKISREHNLPFIAMRLPAAAGLLRDDDIVLDALVMEPPTAQADQWRQYYLNAIRTLKPGLTLLIVHLGHDDAEMKGIMGGVPYGSEWRQRDFDIVSSAEFKQALRDNNVMLVGWKDLKQKAAPRKN